NTRLLRVACAGHPPPLLVAADDGRVAPLGVDSVIALLWDELGHVPVREYALQPGDRVVFYTDGITEREAEDESMFELEGLVDSLSTAGPAAPQAIVDHIVADLDAFAGGHEPGDDQTLLVLGAE